MKKIALIALISSLILGFDSCKKGEDDPFLSLKTRNGRMTGKWKLVKAESENVYSDFYSFTYWGTPSENYSDGTGTSTFDGETLETNVSYKDVYGENESELSMKEIADYELTLEIEKDGTYTWSEHTGYTFSSYIETEVYYGQTYTYSSDTTYNPSENFYDYEETGYWSWLDGAKSKMYLVIDGFGILYIKRLSNKELVLEQAFDTSSERMNETSISRYAEDSKVTFEFEKE